VKTDFHLTTVIRETSKATFPSGVQVAKSDFSLKSLTEIFQGKDAVVSMLPITALADQGVAIEAAIAAGVKRFIPSEYGFDSSVHIRCVLPSSDYKTDSFTESGCTCCSTAI
jgi:hypothetical protein